MLYFKVNSSPTKFTTFTLNRHEVARTSNGDYLFASKQAELAVLVFYQGLTIEFTENV